MTNDCLFCRIARGELEAEIVAEDSEWLAFRDINPQAPSHVLVVPREHVAGLDRLSDRGLAGTLLLAAARVAALEEVVEEGFRVVANTNAAAGQSVPHLHLHVLGGRDMSWPPG